jgi:hypothetical protein
MTARRTRRWRPGWHSSSPCTTTPVAAEARAATPRRTPWRARLRTSRRSSPRPEDRRTSTGSRRAGCSRWRLRPPGIAIDKLALYEVPYDTADDAPERYSQYRTELAAALGEGRRGDAIELFMRLAGSPEADIAGARHSPYWSGMEALAHTLAYDAACYGPAHPFFGPLNGRQWGVFCFRHFDHHLSQFGV